MPGVDYEITEHISTLSEDERNGFTLELNKISYNGRDPKLDLRRWDRKNDRMLKGLTLTFDEAVALMEALENV